MNQTISNSEITNDQTNENKILENEKQIEKPVNLQSLESKNGIVNNNGIDSDLLISEENKDLIQKSENTTTKKQITHSKNPKPTSKKLGLEDFDYIRNLGKGSFGEVVLVKKKSDEKLYAMKAIDKNFLYKEKKQYQVYIEKEVMMSLSHPNLPKFYYCFQDKYKLYFVMELCEKGEFSDFLRLNKKMDLKIIQFYSAEIVNILDYLHSNGVAHRDLKPENLMLSVNNHLKVIDFGTAYFFKSVNNNLLEIINKIRNSEKTEQDPFLDYQTKHKATFVGTAEYVSPELLEDGECEAPADLWALGCIIYRMFFGVTPFFEVTEYLMFNKIKKGDITMSPEIPLNAQDLIKNLLKRHPKHRLGAGMPGEPNDFKALKAHPFFEGIDFDNLSKMEAPFINVGNPKDNNDYEYEYDNLNPYKIKNKQVNSSDDPQKETNIAGTQKTETLYNRSLSLRQGNILLTGLAMKKCGWLFYEPILLVLKDNKKLSYYDSETNKLKGDIVLTNDVQCNLIYKTKFVVILPNRRYYFKEIENTANQWVELINQVINS